MTFQLHLDDLVTAALETLAAEAARALRLAETPEDRRFWRAALNAHTKALANWLAGLRPQRVSGSVLLIPSGTRGGIWHRAERHGGVWVCSCEAGQHGTMHWHDSLITAMEIAADAARRGDLALAA